MIVRCLGGWTERTHVPVVIGDKQPLEDTRISDSACDRCVRAMGATIRCRWCEKVESFTGLCERCELQLHTKMGAPIAELTVYRFGAEPLRGAYDGVGLMLRLASAMKEPEFVGFQIRPIEGAA